jgi:transcriptional regulator with XRE-family HTH domain
MTFSSDHQHLISLGRRIAALRDARGYTEAQLASSAGLPLWRLSAIEEGRLDPDYETLVGLAAALGVGMTELVAGGRESDRT